MKKIGLSLAALMALTGSGLAADMPVKAVKAPPVVASPWDIAFGAALMNDYIFRGVTQSNHKPSVAGYFEARYNVNDTFQLYIGAAGESISFPNRAAAEIDLYAGVRPTFGAFAFDFGLWGYLYPGGACFNGAAAPGSGIPGAGQDCINNGFIPINGNVMKRDVSFMEAFGKVTYTISDNWALGLNEYYSPNFLNTGAWGNYLSGTVKFTAPTSMMPAGIGMYISGELGRQWLGKTDSFYGVVSPLANYATGIPLPSYNTWNVGVGFTYKVFTLDLRYSDTNLTKAQCNAFTGDWTTTSFSPANVTAINPGGFGSNWCGASGIAKLSVDTTLGALK